MYRTRHAEQTTKRRGVILLVVITLLTLFAVVGLAFVLYAEAEANASTGYLDAQRVTGVPDDNLPAIFSWAMGQLLYDVADPKQPTDASAYSGMRGHGLARNMYGFQSGGTNTTPFNGPGRLRGVSQPFPSPGIPPMPQPPKDDYGFVNFTYFPVDGFIRDPEYPGGAGFRSTGGGMDATQQPLLQANFVGANAPYTYWDINNMYLAAVKADGTVLVPSFWRPWTGSVRNDPMNTPLVFGNGLLGPTNWAWTSNVDPNDPTMTPQPYLKYLTLRPRPVDHLGFPAPADNGGDVKNLLGAPGGNDSIWVDLNFPVQVLPDGRKYKPLFAFLIKDLDGLINMNVSGNVKLFQTGPPAAYDHASHHGMGRWEINPKYLAQLTGGLSTTEWQNLLRGNANNNLAGRYGADQGPATAGGNAPALTSGPRFYGRFDYDSRQAQGTNFIASQPLQLPSFIANQNSMSTFPVFQAGPGYGGYESSAAAELGDHPRNYSYFQPVNDDFRFTVQDQKQLMAYFSNNANIEAKYSLLGKLSPNNLLNDPVNSPRMRNLFTTISMDVDRPGVVPSVWDPANPVYGLTIPMMGNPPNYPTGSPPSSPVFPLPSSRGATPAGSEFGANDWRSTAATALGRLDLNRTLTDYPQPDAVMHTFDTTNMAVAKQLQQAQSDRQNFATDIFNALSNATFAGNVASAGAVGSPQYEALRWLAQLAVNIVDFIDNDDISTPFNWDVANNQWVFGTEVPRVVINEVYAQVDNDTTDMTLKTTGKAGFYNVHFWAELHNAHSPSGSAADPDDGVAYLRVGPKMAPYAAYQILITQSNTGLRSTSNVLGTPDNNPGQVLQTVADWGTGATDTVGDVILPSNGAYSDPNQQNAGFFLVGPTNASMANAPQNPGFPTPTHATDLMGFQVNPAGAVAAIQPPTLMLQRLANHRLPLDNRPLVGGLVNPMYNPWITIDYVELNKIPATQPKPPASNTVLQDGVTNDNNGLHMGQLATDRTSYGRKQPYGAESATQWLPSNPIPLSATGPQTTFWRHNAQEAALAGMTVAPALNNTAAQTIQMPFFDWLVHLDRPLVSPVELLHVSGFKPHLLTQQFRANNQPFQHLAPWLRDMTARLYRVFEFVECRDLQDDASVNGRTVGKVNINTILDPETLLALCDPQSANTFSTSTTISIYNNAMPSDPKSVWGRLMSLRTPGWFNNPQALSGTDQPFLSPTFGFSSNDPSPGMNSNAQYPNYSMQNTLMGYMDPTKPQPLLKGVFAVDPDPMNPTSAHPYLQSELLTKLFNNVTTRSNVFGVWCTVGYFQVMDDTARPVKLGPEIGSALGQHVRHRFFSIVDRTNLSIDQNTAGSQGSPHWFLPGLANVPPPANPAVPTIVPVTVVGPQNAANSLMGTYEGVQFTINVNDSLWVDVGNNQEKVTVTAVDNVNKTIQATFSKAHGYGFPIFPANASPGINVLPGNPGPQATFDYRNPRYRGVLRYFTRTD
jgi:hypothetical protein